MKSLFDEMEKHIDWDKIKTERDLERMNFMYPLKKAFITHLEGKDKFEEKTEHNKGKRKLK